jgi:hypothetical protein
LRQAFANWLPGAREYIKWWQENVLDGFLDTYNDDEIIDAEPPGAAAAIE